MDFNLISPERVSYSHGRKISPALVEQSVTSHKSFLRSDATPFMRAFKLPQECLKKYSKISSIFRGNLGTASDLFLSTRHHDLFLVFTSPKYFSLIDVAELCQKTISSMRLHSNFSINMNFFSVHLDFLCLDFVRERNQINIYK